MINRLLRFFFRRKKEMNQYEIIRQNFSDEDQLVELALNTILSLGKLEDALIACKADGGFTMEQEQRSEIEDFISHCAGTVFYVKSKFDGMFYLNYKAALILKIMERIIKASEEKESETFKYFKWFTIDAIDEYIDAVTIGGEVGVSFNLSYVNRVYFDHPNKEGLILTRISNAALHNIVPYFDIMHTFQAMGELEVSYEDAAKHIKSTEQDSTQN